ncbi:hypothetical protein GCM10023149_13820 [Mucilaginibacter gynuensis]|uniref:Heptosyltransferase-2 n=1 Tax=Mucilaginibacter gynuensis TaxID=1302236 RepID=A0ABP8G4A6_9SPHI
MAKRKLTIDSSKGGNGDIWMRLVSFYAIAGILTDLEIHLLIPKFLRNLAQYAFGDRIVIADEATIGHIELSYSNLGMKDLIRGISKGNKYISPYQRSVINDKKKKQLKDSVNLLLFTIADVLGVVQVPQWRWIKTYQGYLDIIGIKKLRSVDYDQYINKMQADYELLYNKLNGPDLPISPELEFPADLHESTVIFPTGTSRQFIPVWWAKQNLPDAYYAFFHKDAEGEKFKEAGLKVVPFYKEAGDIIALSKAAKWTVSTDSFPSHLLQYASETCSITITEVLRSRIISPVFKGKVIDAQVKCHPCLHLDRKNHPLCAAGFSECQNWVSSIYTNDLIQSIAV